MKALSPKTKKALVALIAMFFFMSFLGQAAHAAYSSCDDKSSSTVEVCFLGSLSKEKEKTADIKDDHPCCVAHGHFSGLHSDHLPLFDVSIYKSVEFSLNSSLLEDAVLKGLFRPPRFL